MQADNVTPLVSGQGSFLCTVSRWIGISRAYRSSLTK